jgi:hypothetical protein
MVDPILTRLAHAEYGDNWFRGYSVNDDLAGAETWLGIVALGIAGRRLTEPERGLLDDLGVALTVADPRIWPLKLTRLVSSYGSTLTGLAAGALSLDEALIGHWTTGAAARFLREVRNVTTGADDLLGIEEACRTRLAAPERLIGFGVPFRPVDERVVLLTKAIAARGRDQLEYWKLFGAVADAVLKLKGLRPNMTMAAAAACLDLGFDDRQTATIVSLLGMSDFLANAAESAAQKPLALQRLDLASIRYVGHPPRDSGRTPR